MQLCNKISNITKVPKLLFFKGRNIFCFIVVSICYLLDDQVTMFDSIHNLWPRNRIVFKLQKFWISF